MKPIAKTILIVVVLLASLFLVAGRPIGELFGLVRASADVTVDSLVDGAPTPVTDRMLDHDVRQQRSRVTEHQVALELSRRQIEGLGRQIAELEARGKRRRRLLAEAYPVLRQATDKGLEQVQFAGSKHTLSAFQSQLDALLAEEERESRQLTIRRAGLTKLTTSVHDGERALAEMRDALAGLEQEIDLLRTRRDQAQLEAKTLDLVSAVGSAPSPQASRLGTQAAQLRKTVDRLEAGNQARRSNLPSSASTNRLSADWQRLERLAAFRDGAQDKPAAPTKAKPQTKPQAKPKQPASKQQAR